MGVVSSFPLGWAALAFLVAPVVAAQSNPKRIPYKVTCATCRVELTPLVTIGKRSDPHEIADHSFLDRDRQGRFFAIGVDYNILVYDARGNFLKALGRRGPGPGEFPVPSLLFLAAVAIGAGDSIFVRHYPYVSVFSPALAYVRRFRIPGGAISNMDFRPLADGTFLVSNSIRTPQHAGRPLHVIAGDGTVRRSLGPEQAVGPDLPRLEMRPVFLARDGHTIHLGQWDHRYILESWDLGGRFLSKIEVVDVPFHQKSITREIPRRGRPPTRITEYGGTTLLGVDTLGQLWINVKGAGPTAVRHLEIVEPATGVIRSSQVVAAPVLLLPAGDLAYSATMADDGFVSFTVARYKFVGR